MTEIYKVGTATVSSGSTAVTGTDTGWATALVTGGLFTRNGLSVPIESVEGEGALTLALPWPGSTGTGVYAIMRENSAAASVVDLYDRLRQATITLSLHSIHPDAIGTLTERDALTLGGEDTQFVFLRLETGEPDEYYRWGGAAWVGPFPVSVEGQPGPPGDAGPAGEGFTPAGAWDTGTTYNGGDFVSFGGRTFVSLADGNVGNEPPSADADDANWMWVPTAVGPAGDAGADAFVYIAYASADDGTGFTTTFNPALDYIAILSTDTEIPAPAVGDFAGLWKNYKGAPGNPGNPGADGNDGWSPVLAIVTDGARRVLQVADWAGGEGAKPATGAYVGATGLTATIGDAIDIRGPSGAGTGDVTTSGAVAADRITVYADGTGDSIKDGGVAISDLATAAQGAKADSAVQPGSIGTAAAKNIGTSAGNVPELDGSGKLDTSVLPAVAITDTFVVNSQAAMLALTAEKGDVAIRTDLNKSFILQTNSPTTLADWKELLTPTDAVLSVAGLTGTISASALKTAIAIAVADITDASANGRSLISAANYAAMKTLLSLVKADVGLGNVDNTSDSTKWAAAKTLTNTRITKRIGTTASSATPTPDADSHDQYNVTALATAPTFAAPIGTPNDGQVLIIRIKDNGTLRALAWNAAYRAMGVALPTTTVANKTLYVGLKYNAADSKWDCLAVGQEA